jgi:hypothetical protein
MCAISFILPRSIQHFTLWAGLIVLSTCTQRSKEGAENKTTYLYITGLYEILFYSVIHFCRVLQFYQITQMIRLRFVDQKYTYDLAGREGRNT